MVMNHALGWPGHYSEIVRDGAGFPVSLWPLHPGTTKPMRDGPQKPLYYLDTSTNKKYRPENILHIAGLSFDGICGYSLPQVGNGALGLSKAQETFSASFFGNGAVPMGMLRVPEDAH